MYYYFQKKDNRRAESPEWLLHKEATINQKNEKDNKCFQYAITTALNYIKIKKKYLQKQKKLNRLIQIVNLAKQTGKIFSKKIFASYIIEEIKLAYKSKYSNKRKNHVILLMINDKAEKCYYFAVKDLLELYSFERLSNRKAVIINDDNGFQNALNDALDYQNIETNPQRMSKIKPYISKYNWEGIAFPAWSKDWKKSEQNNKTIALKIIFIPYIIETIRFAYRSEYKNKGKNQVNLIMITDGNKWHYIAISSFPHCLKESYQIITEMFIV